MTGIVPSEEFNEQIKRTVRETIRRQRTNVAPAGRWHKKGGGGGGGGGHIMHYRIDDCDSDNYYVTATEWTGGCTDPPGKDAYTELWTVEKLPCSAPWTVDDIAAGNVHGVAAYTYPLDGSECVPFWKEITSCGPIVC